MENFVKSNTESSGYANLNTLFDSSVPAAQESGSPAPSTDAPEADLGVHGKLGEAPEALATETPAAEGTEQEVASPNWLEFSVTDDKGKRKVKVDLNNKEQLKTTLAAAYGFRKMQAERDNVSARLKEIEPKYTELKQGWDTLENAYQNGGVEGLVDLLGGKKGYYSEWKRSELEKELKYQNASEIEKREIDLRQKLERLEKESTLREKRASEEAARARTEREEAQLRSLESQIAPAFNKYRFAGTLGDTSKEARLDKAIWDQALENLEALPDTVQLTPQMIEREFKQIATEFRAIIGKQAQAQAKQVIENKKQAAQTRVAAAAKTVPLSNIQTSMSNNIKKGGIGGLTDALMDVLKSR